ncbi:MAG: deoxyribose-phosphate aldolase [Actinobacteria bacterium]|nr:deoxyribose-phosphate aldolase [Actinomycetota bacterium]MBU4313243.1 deoxyribose-phosphate aldolase [Actinomycetota bacterium]MBU4482648.1 deoxyribose-phosphate aldolase [Actinomycetota bacterium]MCG2791422.1 deoxyribose-phosphate aldolase [Actinomycetes bacterium]
MVKTLTKEQLAKTIDQTLLNPIATSKDIEQLCINAKNNHFAAVCINPTYIAQAKKILADTDVKVCSVVGYPLGANTIETKVFEARNNVKKGADELDMVINLGAVKSGNYDYVEREIKIVVNVIRREQIAEYNRHIDIKVIIETAILTRDEIKKVCAIIERSGADFVKTSTGFGVKGVELDDVRLIREIVTRNIGVKASGGIRTFKDAQALIDAGATRLGTSSGINIIKEYIAIFDK